MKRYIRTKDNRIVEIVKSVNNIYISKTNEYYYRYKDGIIAESDSVFGLGGYAFFEDINGNIHIIDDIAFDFIRNEWCISVNNVSFFENKIAKLYTKQDDNYFLVWDKERGVI